MRRVLALTWIIAISLAGCAFPLPEPTQSPAQVWLAVYGPRDWIPSESMNLRIGEGVWSITPSGGGGVATPDLTQQATVRLIGMETCREYASFDIAPGSAWIIRFAPDDSVTVEDAAGQAHEMGPGLVEGSPNECDPTGAESSNRVASRTTRVLYLSSGIHNHEVAATAKPPLIL